jgi:hypothetical protein
MTEKAKWPFPSRLGKEKPPIPYCVPTIICPKCDGNKEVLIVGEFAYQVIKCPECDGTGKVEK